MITNRDVAELLCMLTPRGDDKVVEEDWIEQWIMTLPGANADGGGNVWVSVGDSSVMFSAHTDTAHGHKPVIPTITIESGIIRARSNNGRRLILGADDTVGCWIMRRMILHNVPGTYIFHRGEERGGTGSRWIVDNVASKWTQRPFHVAVAFDRKGTKNIITHQGSVRTCSDVFANGLAAKLNEHGLNYAPDDTGSFTDTKNYAGVVPECTNLSVGYFSQHTTGEEIDLPHLLAFTKACIALDWEDLPVARDPSVKEHKSYVHQPYTGTPYQYQHMSVSAWIAAALLTTTRSQLVTLINRSVWDAAEAIEELLSFYEGVTTIESTVSAESTDASPKDGNLEDQESLFPGDAYYTY